MQIHNLRNTLSRICAFVALLLSLFTPVGAQPQDSEDLYFVRGVTFIGTKDQQRTAAPYILRLNEDEDFRQKIGSRLENAAKALRVKSGHRVQTTLASVQGDTYALTFAVTGERVEIEQVGGTQINVQYRMRVAVLVINLSAKPERRRVVALYSVPVTYLTVAERPPTPAEALAVYRRLYLEPPAEVDVLAAWLKVAADLQLREADLWVKVEPFRIQPKAERTMAASGISAAELSQLSRRFTSDAEDGVSARFGIPVIPSVAGDTVDSALTFTFNDSGAAQEMFGSAGAGAKQAMFVFPEPSWIVELSAKDFFYARSKRPSPGGNVVDVIDLAIALDVSVRPASPSHPIPPTQTTFFKRESKAFIDPSRVVQPSADTHRVTERLMAETFHFMVNPAASDVWFKTAHLFPDRSAEVRIGMQRMAQQLSTRRR